MFPSVNPERTSSWDQLRKHFDAISKNSLLELFKEEKNRSTELSIESDDFFVDFSKNHIDQETVRLFESLANECKLTDAKKALFSGEAINQTEKRAVLHTALRNLSNKPMEVDGENVMPFVFAELDKIKEFTKRLHTNKVTGYTGKPIESIVNIGIGGSDLGPFMVINALKRYWKPAIKPFFVSNVDASHLIEVLEQVDPETTLFIIASKTFTTQETMTNANSARDWFLSHAKDKGHVSKHFVAVSTNQTKVVDFGIDPKNMFVFWDWVGGRYSLWSSIGLSIACTVGYDHFEDLLRGAESMDHHFENSPLQENIPTMLAFIGIWYNNFFSCESQAILAYDHLLTHLSRYLQQADMESNGKYVSRTQEQVNYQTGPIIWGEPGTNGQHAFYQLIHQGTKLIPADFIAFAKPSHTYQDHHDKLIANFIAQTEALMTGKKAEVVKEELLKAGKSEAEIEQLLPHKVFQGNRPTTSILIESLTPKSLGRLIAMYEHKIFVQGVIWNIYSFDQWGVELGKQLASSVLAEIKSGTVGNQHDASTKQLISRYLEINE
ncbi:MAG: glucose-6-phosphate isomerase [Cyclobacteriaceae bacterium]|jgi:glucose-6-phosphate isomerase